MRFSDIFRKIINLFKKKDEKKKDYSIRTVNIRFSDIPYSIYLVIKKYGWVVFFRKSIIILKKYPYRKKFTYFKGKTKGFFQKYSKKIRYLLEAVFATYEKEGLANAAKRSLNYVRYGKGVLKKKETKQEKPKTPSKNKYQIIAENLEIDGLDVEKINNLVFDKYDNPEVSIIIPVFNKWQYTYNCLASLKKNMGKGVSFEIIVIDNASSDETPQLFEKIKNVNYVRNEENLNFVGGNNQGIEKSRGKYIVCLNNDTYVLPGWLESLLATVKSDENIGLVGSKLIYPDGRLQEAGGIVWKNEKCSNFGKFQNPDSYEFNYLKGIDYCSAASVVVRGDVFRKLGGFDTIYQPAFFEDTDLAFRIRKMGLRTVYQPKAELIHFEGITAGTSVKTGFKRFQEINKEKFFGRWKKVLEHENFSDTENKIFLARDRAKGKKIMLFVDNNVPTYDQDAGSFIAFEYLKTFLSLGYKIVFWPHNLMKLDPYTETLQQLGIEVVYGNVSFEKYIEENGKFFNLAILSRPNVSELYIDLVKKNTDAKIFYMAHDLHFLREMRAAEYGNSKTNQDFEKTKKTELSLMRKSDATLVFSDVEDNIIKKDYPEINIATIPWVEKISLRQNKHFSEKKGLLFLGGFGHPPNPDAVLWFRKEIFPIIKKKIPEIFVTILGSKPTEGIRKLDKEDFRIVGFVKDGDLPKYFLDHKIFISPLRFGAGFKGKNARSMSLGLPLITTAIGAEGIGIVNGETGLIADTAEDFAEAVINLYGNKNVWEKISKNSVEYVAKNYSQRSAQEKIEEIVGKI